MNALPMASCTPVAGLTFSFLIPQSMERNPRLVPGQNFECKLTQKCAQVLYILYLWIIEYEICIEQISVANIQVVCPRAEYAFWLSGMKSRAWDKPFFAWLDLLSGRAGCSESGEQVVSWSGIGLLSQTICIGEIEIIHGGYLIQNAFFSQMQEYTNHISWRGSTVNRSNGVYKYTSNAF